MESGSAVQKRVEDQKGPDLDRPLYRFDIPGSILAIQPIKQVGLVQINSSEEIRATKRARNDSHQMAYSLAKQSLVEVDGKPVSEGDGSADKVWDAMHPKVRVLVVTAYGELHTPEDEDIKDFLKSQKVTVG